MLRRHLRATPPPRRTTPDLGVTARARLQRPWLWIRPHRCNLPAGPTRAGTGNAEPSGDDGSRGGRPRRPCDRGVVAAVLIVGAGAAFALGAFSGGDDGGSEEAAPKISNNVDLQDGTGPGVLAGGSVPMARTCRPELTERIHTVIGEYVDNGIVAGLRSGKVKDADLTDAFDEAALARLKGDDRGVLLDEGLPKATGKLSITSNQPTNIFVLNDGQGVLQVASVVLDLTIHVTAEKGTYDIVRTGQLELTPDATRAWKITGWDLNVQRTGVGLPAAQQTPTTAPPPTAPGTPTTVAAGPTTTAGTQ